MGSFCECGIWKKICRRSVRIVRSIYTASWTLSPLLLMLGKNIMTFSSAQVLKGLRDQKKWEELWSKVHRSGKSYNIKAKTRVNSFVLQPFLRLKLKLIYLLVTKEKYSFLLNPSPRNKINLMRISQRFLFYFSM